jgi:hypothetical protein
MSLLSHAKSLFRSLFRRREIDADLDAEIRSTVEMLADEKATAGMPPSEARRAARIEVGGVEQVKEEVRSRRAGAWLDTLLQDLRFSLRMLWRSPGFTVVVIITLALGIGVNTAIFSIVNDLVLRPLPVAQPSEIAFLLLSWKSGDQTTAFAYPYFREIQKRTSNIFSGVTAMQPFQMDGLSINRKSEPMWTGYVTGNFFDVLGVKPVLGRLILPSEGRTAGADPVLVISYAYWKSRFNRDPRIIGRKVTVNGHPMTLVGVTPQGFHGLTSLLDTQGYIPLGMAATLKDAAPDFLTATNSGSDAVVVRLRPGVDLKQAQSALRVIANRMALEHPDLKGLMNFRILHLGPAGLAINPTNPEAMTLVSALFLALAGSVLALACVNIANPTWLRSARRSKGNSTGAMPPSNSASRSSRKSRSGFDKATFARALARGPLARRFPRARLHLRPPPLSRSGNLRPCRRRHDPLLHPACSVHRGVAERVRCGPDPVQLFLEPADLLFELAFLAPDRCQDVHVGEPPSGIYPKEDRGYQTFAVNERNSR